jgi:Domain of unknown function (DUF6924)
MTTPCKALAQHNMDWEDFANAVGDDGVFRGFGG